MFGKPLDQPEGDRAMEFTIELSDSIPDLGAIEQAIHAVDRPRWSASIRTDIRCGWLLRSTRLGSCR